MGIQSKKRIDRAPESVQARNQEWPFFDRSEAMSRQSTAHRALSKPLDARVGTPLVEGIVRPFDAAA